MNTETTSLRQEFNRLATCDLCQDDIHLSRETTKALIQTYKKLNYMMPFLEIKIDNDKITTYHVDSDGQLMIVNQKMSYICLKYKNQLGNKSGLYDVITVSLLSSDFKNTLSENFIDDVYYLSALYIIVQHLTLGFKTPVAWRFFVHKKYYINTTFEMPEPFYIDIDNLLEIPTGSDNVAQKYFKMQTYLQRKYIANSSQYSPPLLIANAQTFAFNIPEYKFTQVKHEMDRQIMKTESFGNNYMRPLFTFHYTVDDVTPETFYHMSNLYWNVCMYKEMYNKLPISTLVYDTQYLMNKLTLSKPVPKQVPDYAANVVEFLDSDGTIKYTFGVLHTLDDFEGTVHEKENALVEKFKGILARFKEKLPDAKPVDEYLWIDKVKKEIVMRLGSSNL